MKLALGTAQFGLPYGIANQGGQVTLNAVASILALARQKGVHLLDTAIAYGDSEACLGEAGTEGFSIVTKLPELPAACDSIPAWVREQVQNSLRRLGQSSLYGLLLHRAPQLAGPDGRTLAKALQTVKDEGLVRKIGVSVYSPAELEAVLPVCPPDLIQAPFNLVDRRLHTSGWLDRLHGLGVEIHVRSAFLQGLLLMPQADIPRKFRRWNALWDRWHAWLECRDVPAIKACLAYPLSFKQIDRVVVGVETAAQLEQLIEAGAKVASTTGLPDLACDDERLVNPSLWNSLEIEA